MHNLFWNKPSRSGQTHPHGLRNMFANLVDFGTSLYTHMGILMHVNIFWVFLEETKSKFSDDEHVAKPSIASYGLTKRNSHMILAVSTKASTLEWSIALSLSYSLSTRIPHRRSNGNMGQTRLFSKTTTTSSTRKNARELKRIPKVPQKKTMDSWSAFCWRKASFSMICSILFVFSLFSIS